MRGRPKSSLAEQLERFRHSATPEGAEGGDTPPAVDDTDVPPVPSRFYMPHDMRPTSDAFILRLREFAYRIIVLGDSAQAAGRAVGWSASKTHNVRFTPEYAEIRAELVAEYGQKREAALNEIYAVVNDTAYHGAMRQNEIIHASADDRLVNDVANQAMDRIGARAAAKVDQRVTIELSPETAALIAKAQAVARLPQVPLEQSEFAYALERPSVGTEQARELIGTAAVSPDDGEQP